MNKREQEEASALKDLVFKSTNAVHEFLNEPRTRLPPFTWHWLEQEAWLSGVWMARDRIMDRSTKIISGPDIGFPLFKDESE